MQENGIGYTERDVTKDPEARKFLIDNNVRGVPTFKIGEELIVGLDKEKILEAYK